MVDIKPFVEELMQTGLAQEAAEEKIRMAIDAIKRTMGDRATDEFIEARLKLSIATSQTKTGDAMKITIIGYDKCFDVNAKARASAEEMFKTNPQRAIAEKYVKTVEEDGEVRPEYRDGAPIFLDNKEFIDEGKTMKNYSYGKELKPYYKRTAVGLTEEGDLILTEVYGEQSPEIGHEYSVYGKKNANGVFRGNKRGMKYIREVNKSELWEKLFAACATCEIAKSLTDLPNLTDYSVYVTYGIISSVSTTSNDSVRIVVKDENCPSGVTGFSLSDPNGDNKPFWNIANACETAVVGSEALVVGKGKVKNDGTYTMNVLGIIQPYVAEAQASVQNELDRIFGGE